jgi:hypothetical protein
MPKYIATILLDVDKIFKDRKPNKAAIKGFLENSIRVGEVNESYFRNGKVIMKIKKIKVLVMEVD